MKPNKGIWSSSDCCYDGQNVNFIACDYEDNGYVYVSKDGGSNCVRQNIDKETTKRWRSVAC